jgi:hypothetical protein
MNYFRYEHAARTWAYQQKRWYGRDITVAKLGKPTPEGAYWVVDLGVILDLELNKATAGEQ